MKSSEGHHRFIVSVSSTEVVLTLLDAMGRTAEKEKFALPDGADPMSPQHVIRDVFNLIYQCVSDSTHKEP
jgi:hypothetical protein